MCDCKHPQNTLKLAGGAVQVNCESCSETVTWLSMAEVLKFMGDQVQKERKKIVEVIEDEYRKCWSTAENSDFVSGVAFGMGTATGLVQKRIEESKDA